MGVENDTPQQKHGDKEGGGGWWLHMILIYQDLSFYQQYN